MEYRAPREGPAHYLIWQPGCSQIRMTRRDVLRAIKWPIKTPTGDALRAWLDEIDAMNAPAPEALDMEQIKKEGWGPEAHGLDESDPNFQTRTVL